MNKNYSYVDAFVLAKLAGEYLTNLYKSKNNVLLNRVINSEDNKIISDYGMLSLRSKPAKTTKIYTEEEIETYNQLQKKIDLLIEKQNELGTTKVVEEASKTLVCKSTEEGLEEAQNLASAVANILNNVSLYNKIDKDIAAAKKSRVK